MTDHDEPFLRSIPKRWIPPEMIHAPVLDHSEPRGFIERRYALLINPFYPKDANASFGKHVLTPTLALTSFAATTPARWRVEYWDENLLHGRPPCEPMPQVVGITVHLTFAGRAYELADWYRARGSKVILGGLHVLSCPEECAPHADALALGDGVQLWPRILTRYRSRSASGTLCRDVRERLPRRSRAAALHSAASQFSDDHQPDRHARLPQPLRLLLSRDRWPAYAVSHAGPATGRRRVRGRRSALRGVHRQQPRLAAATTCTRLCRPCGR